MACVDELLPLMRPGRDWLALGGFCIIGRVPSLKPLFYEVLDACLTRCKARGINASTCLASPWRMPSHAPVRQSGGMASPYRPTVPGQSSAPSSGAATRLRDGRPSDTKAREVRRLSPRHAGAQNIEDYHNWISNLQEAAA